jgi:hypothetical protein
MNENVAPRQGRVLVADANLHMLRGVHTLLENLFDATVMVSDERSLLETAANTVSTNPGRVRTEGGSREEISISKNCYANQFLAQWKTSC